MKALTTAVLGDPSVPQVRGHSIAIGQGGVAVVWVDCKPAAREGLGQWIGDSMFGARP